MPFGKVTNALFFAIVKDMWNYFKPENTRWYRWRLDGASAYVRKNGDEWRTLVVPIPFQNLRLDSGGPELFDPPSLTDSSFSVAPGEKIALRPAMPALPYLIVAKNNVRIMVGSEARFDVLLPVPVRFEIEGGSSICESMPFFLSNTWFGDTSVGSLCISLPTELDPLCPGETEDPTMSLPLLRSLVRCEITVRNDSKSPIDLKRFAIYTDLLNIYEESGWLVTDPIRIDGLLDGGLKMSVSAASGDRRLLTRARVSQREFFVRRGVNFLRTITGIGV